MKIRHNYGFQWLRDGLSMKVENCTVDERGELLYQQFDKASHRNSSVSLEFETNQRRRDRVYREILRSFDELRIRSRGLEEAKSKILRFLCSVIHIFTIKYFLCSCDHFGKRNHHFVNFFLAIYLV